MEASSPFSCKKHSKLWLENVEYAGEYFSPRKKNDFHTITLDWFKAEMKDYRLKVTIAPIKKRMKDLSNLLSPLVTSSTSFISASSNLSIWERVL